MAEYVKTAVYDEASFDAIQSIEDVTPEIQAAARLAKVTDSSETMVFARQLETVKSTVYQKKYPEFKGRKFVPVSYAGGPDSEYITYRIWDAFGMAMLVTNYATDFPLVSASAEEVTMKYFDIGAGYAYSIQDLRFANRAGVALNSRLAEACRRAVEQGVDDAIANGMPQVKAYGLLNNPNVSLLSLTTGTWSSATGEQILADLNQIVTNFQTLTLGIYSCDTIVMTIAAKRHIETKLLNTANGSNITVLEAFRRQNPGVQVDDWIRCSNANAAGTNGRIVAYTKNSEVLEFEMGHEFEIQPPEQRAMSLYHVAKARMAGVAIHHPLAVVYCDNQLM